MTTHEYVQRTIRTLRAGFSVDLCGKKIKMVEIDRGLEVPYANGEFITYMDLLKLIHEDHLEKGA